jgi:hypothetical protein
MGVEFLIAALALAAIGTAVGTYSAIAQAQAQQDAYEYQAQVNQNNAIAQQQAADYEAAQTRDRYRKTVGAQKARYAAAGVEYAGSSLDVAFNSIQAGEMDALVAEYGGKIGSNRFLAQSQMDASSAEGAMSAGYLKAGSTFATGASSGISTYSRYDTNPSDNPAL